MSKQPDLREITGVSERQDTVVWFCTKCAEQFTTISSWKRHEKFCSPPCFACPICEKQFRWVGNAENHFQKEHAAQMNTGASLPGQQHHTIGVRCELCRRVFVNAIFRDMHIEKEHGQVGKHLQNAENRQREQTQGLQFSDEAKWIVHFFKTIGLDSDTVAHRNLINEIMVQHRDVKISRRTLSKLQNPPKKICLETCQSRESSERPDEQ